MDQGQLRAGRLLVANPLLPDPNFDRTVVLLVAYNERDGALGLVLNRPSRMEVASPLPQWRHLAAEPRVVFVGGPVQRQAVICLARSSGFGLPDAATTSPGGDQAFKPLTSHVGTLDLDSDPGALSGLLSEVRVFAGYAGWAAGQLEGEIAAGAWWVVDAEGDDPFFAEPEKLWKRVLRRQRGPLRFVAYYPDDPSAN
ncbi:MAG TPA: YqgE/AlgH family protein [Acidimicrobiales bacterium]|nr:YqgE/AlgH family protein [Acidimicrobiales bacterium]